MIASDLLLAGPRGRRLLLELAVELELRRPEPREHLVGDAVAAASFALRTAREDGGTRLASFVGDVTPESVTPRPGATTASVAAAVSALLATGQADGSDSLDHGIVHRALVRAVDMAAYWQEPGTEDIVASHPAVREALRPLAERLADAPASAWWDAPVAIQDQWAVAWDGREPEVPRSPAELLQGWRERVDEGVARARRDRPVDPRANWSGEWWSTPPHDLARSARRLADVPGRLPAALEFVEDSLGWEEANVRRLGVPAGLRILELRSADDWARLCRDHPLEVTPEVRQDWFRTTGRDGTWLMPDWASVAAECDAVHLTVAAYLSAGTAIPVDSDTASVIAGWNPDETYWFTDRVRLVDAVEPWRFIDRERWEAVSG